MPQELHSPPYTDDRRSANLMASRLHHCRCRRRQRQSLRNVRKHTPSYAH